MATKSSVQDLATLYQTPGERLAALRKERGCTQGDLAELLNTTKATISRYESNLIDIPRTKIQKLAEYFMVTPAFLMGWTNARDGSDLFTTYPPDQIFPQEVALYKAQKKLTFTEDQLLYMLMRYAEPEEGESPQDFRKRVIKCFVSEVWVYDEKLEIYFNLTGEDDEPRRFVFEQTENCSTNSFYARTQVRVYVTPCGFVVEKETTRA